VTPVLSLKFIASVAKRNSQILRLRRRGDFTLRSDDRPFLDRNFEDRTPGNRGAMTFVYFSHGFCAAKSWVAGALRRGGLERRWMPNWLAIWKLWTADFGARGHAPDEAARRARIALARRRCTRKGCGLRSACAGGTNWRGLALRGADAAQESGVTAIAGFLWRCIGRIRTIFSSPKSLLYDRLDVPRADQLRLLRWIGDKTIPCITMWGIILPGPAEECGARSFLTRFQQLRAHNQVMQISRIHRQT